jgi:uncharacterized FAD-dependent dehydrogenase
MRLFSSIEAAVRYLISNLSVDLGEETKTPAALLAAALGGSPEDYREVVLERRSLDARHKGAIRFLMTLSAETELNLGSVAAPAGVKVELAAVPVDWSVASVRQQPRVVVVGTGPAGTFCALRLLDYGIAPIVLERGPSMEERVRQVNRLWEEGVLDPTANAQFGEGGAGTFSDGKLTTRIGHPAIRYVLETFVRFGADPRVLYLAKPHVGTDVIRRCAVLMRRSAESRGAEYRFKARLVDLRVQDGAVCGVVLESGEEIPCDAVVLAPGHSARDTFEMLHRHGIAMRQKAFAMGVRIEHPQDFINQVQYGSRMAHPSLPAADYKLVCNLGSDRAAYSFCMCPGGEVIQCASESGGVVVNGMSNAKRDSGFANAGLVAKVNPADFTFSAAGSRPRSGPLGRPIAHRPNQSRISSGPRPPASCRARASGPMRSRRISASACQGLCRTSSWQACRSSSRRCAALPAGKPSSWASKAAPAAPSSCSVPRMARAPAILASIPVERERVSPEASPVPPWTVSGWRSGSPGKREHQSSCPSSAGSSPRTAVRSNLPLDVTETSQRGFILVSRIILT